MLNDVERLRNRFREGRAALFQPSARTAPCRELLEKYTALIDGIVEEIYLASCNAADQQVPRTERSGLAIVATGGYGRRELNPFSDVDIAFIPSEEEDPWVESAVHTAFKLVMDIFLTFREIRVGYSFRPVMEVCTWDLKTRTALLDMRHLNGDERLTAALASGLRTSLTPLDLVLELQSRGPSPKGAPASLYSVEPNLKEGRGSLRDLHRGRWIYKLLLGVDQPSLFPDLEILGRLPSLRIAEVQAAAEWFWRARTWLHLATGKKSDVLMNNYQDKIAHELDGLSAQEWLSKHYAHAENLARFCDAAVRAVLEGPLDLGGILLEGGTLSAGAASAAEGELQQRAGGAVRLFRLSQKYSIPVSLSDLKSLEESREEAARIPEPSAEEAWAFLGILNEIRQIAPTLRELARCGLMDRFITGFSDMMRFAPPDPAHSYTVGEHSLIIVEHLENLRAGRGGSLPRFTELVAQCSHFDVLCLAALLHDSGKLLPGDDHSEAGIPLTQKVGRRLGLAPEKLELLEILVRHHLLLVRTARLQDLKSPAVIQGVAERVRSVDALRHLYVFSYVDTRAVAEKNWTSMDFRDLEDLYKKVQETLSGSGREGAGLAVRDKIGLVRRKLGASKGPDAEEAVRRHCDAMPAGYVLNTPLDEITAHIQLLNRLESEGVVLDIYNRPGDDYSELTVCTYDDPRPGMLAKITGVLYGCNVDIHKAQVYTLEKERPVVLDTLWIRAAGMQISENRARRLRASLKEILGGERCVEDFLRAAGKHPPESIPVDGVNLRNDLSEEHTVVHVVARDLQGLLYLMTRGLSRAGLHIHSAKVATWNARAENNFYVTTVDGKQLPDSDLADWKNRVLRAFAS